MKEAVEKSDYETLTQRVEYQEQYINQLLHIISEFKRHRFGKKSESFYNPLQEQFPGLELPAADKIPEVPEITIDAHQRKKHKKNHEELPRHIVIIPVEEKDRICLCGCQKTFMRYEITEKLHYQPAIFEIIEEKREILACPKHCEKSISIASLPERALPKISITESFLAYIIVAKFDDRQPLYHLEKKFKSRFGLNISRQCMARWLIECAKALMPLYNLLKDSIIDYDIASMDATTLQVLDEPDRKATTKSYVYCFRGGGKGEEAIMYAYNEKEHKAFVANWFTGFKGYVHSDADSFFSALYARENVNAVLCNTHSRRRIQAITKISKKKGLAFHAMTVYSKLYRIETKARLAGMSAEERYALRQEYAKPLLIEFKQWLQEKAPLVPQKSPISKAIKYTLNHWAGLTRYLEDGRLLIDNNHTERSIKPFVIARKNFLFAKSQAGARAMCLHFSLIRTAKQHGLDPWRYYEKILKQIPSCKTLADYEALLPWQIDMAKVNPGGS